MEHCLSFRKKDCSLKGFEMFMLNDSLRQDASYSYKNQKRKYQQKSLKLMKEMATDTPTKDQDEWQTVTRQKVKPKSLKMELLEAELREENKKFKARNSIVNQQPLRPGQVVTPGILQALPRMESTHLEWPELPNPKGVMSRKNSTDGEEKSLNVDDKKNGCESRDKGLDTVKDSLQKANAKNDDSSGKDAEERGNKSPEKTSDDKEVEETNNKGKGSAGKKKTSEEKDNDEYEDSSEHFEAVVKGYEELEDGQTDGWLFQSLILLARGFEVDHQEKKLLAPDLSEKHFRSMFETFPAYMKLTLELSTKLPTASGVVGQPTDAETLAEILHKVADNYKPAEPEAKEIRGFMMHPGNICIINHMKALNLKWNSDLVTNGRIIFSAVTKHKQYYYRTLRIQENQKDLIRSGIESLDEGQMKFDQKNWSELERSNLTVNERGELLEMLVLAKKAVDNLDEAMKKMFQFKRDIKMNKFVTGFARIYKYKVVLVRDLGETIKDQDVTTILTVEESEKWRIGESDFPTLEDAKGFCERFGKILERAFEDVEPKKNKDPINVSDSEDESSIGSGVAIEKNTKVEDQDVIKISDSDSGGSTYKIFDKRENLIGGNGQSMNILADIIATPYDQVSGAGPSGPFQQGITPFGAGDRAGPPPPFTHDQHTHFGRSVIVQRTKFPAPPPVFRQPPPGYSGMNSDHSSRAESVDVTHMCCENNTCTAVDCETCKPFDEERNVEPMRSSSPNTTTVTTTTTATTPALRGGPVNTTSMETHYLTNQVTRSGIMSTQNPSTDVTPAVQRKMLEACFSNNQRHRDLMQKNDEINKKEIERRDKEIELYKRDKEVKRLEIETMKEELRIQKIRERDLKSSLCRDNEIYEDNRKKQAMKEQELINKLNETQENMQSVLAHQESVESRYKKMIEKVESNLRNELRKRDEVNEKKLEEERAKTKDLSDILGSIASAKKEERKSSVKFDLGRDTDPELDISIPPPIIKKAKGRMNPNKSSETPMFGSFGYQNEEKSYLGAHQNCGNMSQRRDNEDDEFTFAHTGETEEANEVRSNPRYSFASDNFQNNSGRRYPRSENNNFEMSEERKASTKKYIVSQLKEILESYEIHEVDSIRELNQRQLMKIGTSSKLAVQEMDELTKNMRNYIEKYGEEITISRNSKNITVTRFLRETKMLFLEMQDQSLQTRKVREERMKNQTQLVQKSLGQQTIPTLEDDGDVLLWLIYIKEKYKNAEINKQDLAAAMVNSIKSLEIKSSVLPVSEDPSKIFNKVMADKVFQGGAVKAYFVKQLLRKKLTKVTDSKSIRARG